MSKNSIRIVVLDGHTLNPGDNPWTPVEALGDVKVFAKTLPEQLLERASGAEVLLTNKTVLDAKALAALPQLRLICVLATGYNVVDVEAAARAGVVVCNVPDYASESVAQFTLALLMELTYRLGEHDREIRQGRWNSCGHFSFTLHPLREWSGKTFGLVGLGRIGTATARLMAALGMRVVAHTRTPRANAAGIEQLSLERLLEQSDVVSLHCPLTAHNRGMVNSAFLARMKRGALLINTARGGLIDEADLAEALRMGHLGGAGLDVLNSEPPAPGSPILAAPNCVLAPHMAWATVEARARLMQVTAENIRAFLRGTPVNKVS